MIFPKVRTIFQNSRRPHIHPACRWAFPLIFSKYIGPRRNHASLRGNRHSGVKKKELIVSELLQVATPLNNTVASTRAYKAKLSGAVKTKRRITT